MSMKWVLGRDRRKYLLPMERAWGAETHAYLPELTDQLDRGVIDRRDFLRQACLLGMTSTAAYAMADTLVGGAPFASPAAAQGTPKMGGTLRVSMVVQEMTDPATFDWTEKSNVARFIVEYLTRTQEDNVTVPYLAERWEASDDLKSWVFHLRKDITWSNGDAFTAEDVAHTVNRWLDPQTGSSNLGLFSAMVEEIDSGEKDKDGKPKMIKRGISGAVEVVDDHTIKFNLRQPALAMPENFYNYPTAIVHRSFGKDGPADLSKNPIGTGPMELAEFRVGEKAVLKKRQTGWWAGDFYLDEIQYIDHGQDTNAWVAALISNQVDTLYRLPVESVQTIKRIPTLDVKTATTAQTAVARFRITEKPFDNVNVRRAIMACMDHNELAEKGFSGLGVPAENDHVCPVHPDYADLPKPKRDIELAKKLLKDAGYENGLRVSIANGDTNGPWMTSTLSILKAQCAPAGIDITINKMPSSQYWEIWTQAPWGFTAWTHRPLGTMVLSLAYRSGVPWNESAFSDPAFDKALDEAEAELDINKRREKVTECRKILQDAAVIPQPLWCRVSKGINKKVKGLEVHPTLYHQFQNVWLDT